MPIQIHGDGDGDGDDDGDGDFEKLQVLIWVIFLYHSMNMYHRN